MVLHFKFIIFNLNKRKICKTTNCAIYKLPFFNFIKSNVLFSNISESVYFVTGQRGKPKLVINGYSFIRNKTTAERLYWNCAHTKSKKCRARIVTAKDENFKNLKINNLQHNHKPDIC